MNEPENNPTFPPPKPLQSQFNLLTTVQHNVSSLLKQITQTPSSVKTHLQSALSGLQAHSNQALNPSRKAQETQALTRIPPDDYQAARAKKPGMSIEAIGEKLAGVPVYALSNEDDGLLFVSGASTNKALGLFCFKKEDAEAILKQIATWDPTKQPGTKVVAVPLSEVLRLKVDGVAFRLLPDPSEVKHAIKERENAGFQDGGFLGVPVFQANFLVLESENKTYRPAFFRKEDLENSFLKASRGQGLSNPVFRKGEIKVAVLEEVIKNMENNSSRWKDVVFIPPGFDASTVPSKVN